MPDLTIGPDGATPRRATLPHGPVQRPMTAPSTIRVGENSAGGRWSWFVASFLCMSAFALGFTKTYDSDAWWHLALVRTIVEGRGFPAHEPVHLSELRPPVLRPRVALRRRAVRHLSRRRIRRCHAAQGDGRRPVILDDLENCDSPAALIHRPRPSSWRWRASSCFRRSSLSRIASSSAPIYSSCSFCR